MWLKRGLYAAVLVAGAAACSSSSSTGGGDTLVDELFTQDEWTKIKTLSPLPDLPKDTTNKLADDPTAATFGQRLFFDKAFSGPITTPDDGTNGGNGTKNETGKIGCVSCHLPASDWIDKRTKPIPSPTSLGADWMVRNASTPVNASYYTWLENDGIRDSQWSDCLTDPEDPHSMNGSRLLVAHTLFNKYRADYDAIFTTAKLDPALDPADPMAARFPPDGKPKAQMSDPDGPWEKMAPADKKIVMTIYANFGKVIQAYLRKLVSKNAPFDKYVAGTTTAIGAAEKRGLKLFIGKAGCVGCHNTPLFSDNKFHDTGIKIDTTLSPHADPTETGRYAGIGAVLSCEFNSNTEFSDDTTTKRIDGLVATDADTGKWRTKGLREIALTAPYTHAGQFATLTDVLKFYNKGGDDMGYVGTKDMLMKPLNLTDAEISDIVAFLATLTGEAIPAALGTDTSAP